MDKKKKITVIIVAIIIVAVIVYFIFFNNKDTQPTSLVGKVPVPPNSTPAISTGTETEESYPVQSGSQGDKTKSLQTALNRIGGNTNRISEDGVFGNNTKVKLITTVSTSMYGAGPSVNEPQLTAIIAMGNNA